METRVAVMGIIVENTDSVEKLNALLHEYGSYIIGRMGIPYRSRGISIVSIAIDEEDPFMMIDLNCIGYPHCSSVTREQLSARNDRYSHMFKLWTANMKHHVRGADCRGDILRMVRRINISDAENHSDAALLEKTLRWLEENAPAELAGLTASCRRHFDALT